MLNVKCNVHFNNIFSIQCQKIVIIRSVIWVLIDSRQNHNKKVKNDRITIPIKMCFLIF